MNVNQLSPTSATTANEPSVDTKVSMDTSAKAVRLFDPQSHGTVEERDEDARTFLQSAQRHLDTETKMTEAKKISFCINPIVGVPRRLAEHEWQQGNFDTMEKFIDWFKERFMIPDTERRRTVLNQLKAIPTQTGMFKVIVMFKDLWELNKIQPAKVSEDEFIDLFMKHVHNPGWHISLGLCTSFESVLKTGQMLATNAKRQQDAVYSRNTSGNSKRKPWGKAFKNPRGNYRNQRDGRGGLENKDHKFLTNNATYGSGPKDGRDKYRARIAHMVCDPDTGKWTNEACGDNDSESGKD
ncbi:hypothetical protein HF325_006208 [Metschnikowia pulcherrima]|uniref:Uncharacterized protein n=1 Tax=Metschnikowia pulcherrima TaxID=27326 RepID=A0A8H7LBZ2_9ASCO|nr:hypothetical protein HF325_006208 [Metschnikowia pulcherrima]